MRVLIKPASANHPDLMAKLQCITVSIINNLYKSGIWLPDDSINIWVKQYDENRVYLKIEFHVAINEELEYDLNKDGELNEVHFKSFAKQPNGKIKRCDHDKQDAHPLLAKIDDIIQPMFAVDDPDKSDES
jgi:hypothetical protein